MNPSIRLYSHINTSLRLVSLYRNTGIVHEILFILSSNFQSSYTPKKNVVDPQYDLFGVSSYYHTHTIGYKLHSNGVSMLKMMFAHTFGICVKWIDFTFYLNQFLHVCFFLSCGMDGCIVSIKSKRFEANIYFSQWQSCALTATTHTHIAIEFVTVNILLFPAGNALLKYKHKQYLYIDKYFFLCVYISSW